MNRTLQEQLKLWCAVRHLPTPQANNDKYEGLEACRKNVIRTNNSRKLQYCKETKI
jgi:hypothetical protein